MINQGKDVRNLQDVRDRQVPFYVRKTLRRSVKHGQMELLNEEKINESSNVMPGGRGDDTTLQRRIFALACPGSG